MQHCKECWHHACYTVASTFINNRLTKLKHAYFSFILFCCGNQCIVNAFDCADRDSFIFEVGIG